MNFEALLKKKREAELLRGQMERNALRSFEQDFLIEYTHNSTERPCARSMKSSITEKLLHMSRNVFLRAGR